MLQQDDGGYNGDYGGPMFLLPGLAIVWYVTKECMERQGLGKEDVMFKREFREGGISYLRNHQQRDGGWGTHIEGPSTMFGTVMCYVAVRIMGVGREDDMARRGREFIRKNGGAGYTSSWAKFYLCILGLMDWRSHNSTPCEMFLLPRWFPFHPGRMWCHARMVYLPMSWLYCKRWVYPYADSDTLIKELREELYEERWTEVEWGKYRTTVADMDNYSPVNVIMKTAQAGLDIYENSR